MYYLIYLVGFMISVFKENKKIYLWGFSLSILLLAFFRFGVGPDYFSYQYLYSRIDPSPIKEMTSGLDNQEVLFRLIGSIFKYLNIPYQVYLGAFSFVIILYTYRLCVRYSRKPIQSLFLYYSFFYFVWTFSGIRQGVVISVGMYYLIECIESLKHLKIIIVVTFLSMIHVSAVFILFLYVGNIITLDRKKMILISIFAVVFSFIPLVGLVDFLSNYVSLFDRLKPYLDKPLNVLSLSYIVRVLLLVTGVVFYNLFIDFNTDKIIINTYIIGLSSYFILSFSELAAARISIYGYYFIILIIPSIMEYFKTYSIHLALILLFLGSFFYFNKEIIAMKHYSTLITQSNYVPYTNIITTNSTIKYNNKLYELLYD